MRLDEIHSPRDIQSLSWDEMEDLAQKLREEIITTVSKRGGHLASNLGVVELTLALHRVFDMPRDKIIFDVGHQTYVHKLLTGRYWQFQSLRTFGGMSGFPKKAESPYDIFETGHSSTAISAALGFARARDLQHQDHHVVAVVGDGALTGGMCYEALNDAGSSNTRMIVILNDNEMSISPNVGALSQHLTYLRISKGWTSTKHAVRTRLERTPLIGKRLYRFIHLTKGFIKSIFIDEGFFSALGFHYYGPIDGHDLKRLEHTLKLAKSFNGPVVIHVITQKGHGYDKAEEQPDRFHGTPPFYVETGDVKSTSTLPPFGEVMCDELINLAQKDAHIVAVSAAMISGTGLTEFQNRYPSRMFDVGIAEQHAVTMSAGLASGGMRPYFAVYATFFQRAWDQTIHDVCLQNLPVVFLLDRAGLVGEDGATHHGLFDFASLIPAPHLTVLAPRDAEELRHMIRWTPQCSGPVAIRYGKTTIDMSKQYPYGGFTPGKWEILEHGGDCALLAVGSMVQTAIQVHDILSNYGLASTVVNCSSVKPIDISLLQELSSMPLFTLEEHMLNGGFGESICASCAKHHLDTPAEMFGIPDTFIQHGSRLSLLKYLGLLPEQIAERVRVIVEDLKEMKQNCNGSTQTH